MQNSNAGSLQLAIRELLRKKYIRPMCVFAEEKFKMLKGNAIKFRDEKNLQELFIYGIELYGKRVTGEAEFEFNDNKGTKRYDIGMTYAKFFAISRVLHMNLEYLENIMNYIFKKYFIPSSIMSVDEGLLRFLGRYAWKVHIPNKTACEGIKYFAMACSSTGYLFS